MPVTVSDLARMAGNIASGFVSKVEPIGVLDSDFVEKIAIISLELASSIALKIDTIEAAVEDEEQVNDASRQIALALNGDDDE